MSDSTVRLKIKITDENSIKNVEMSADQLRDAIEQVKNEADKLNGSLINSNQIAQAFEQVSSAVQEVQSVMHDLTDAYAGQAQAETRLATVMRNTMDATEDEIQSIKDLTSAQQKLGVVGDEVQLSGAQELATYLGKKESLEKLIPVMNDMIAQQYGYNATAESAVGIATMMGKVMEGQTKALSRYGYSFTEAQEEILKFGTEEERAATLAEVIEQSVGGVNAALAATDYGKIVQANNKFGDLKETIGSLVAPAMTVVDNISRITIAIAGIGKGFATIKSLTTSIKALGVHSKVTAAAQRMLGAAGITAAAGTTALRVSVAALYATMTLGLSLAIQGIITLVTNLTGRAREAADGMNELKEANEAYKNAAGQAKAEIETEIAALKRLMEQEEDTADAVRHLNEKYGEIFGSHQTAAEWYDTLTQKSQTYCRQLGYEAKAKSLASAIGAKMVERDDLQKEYDRVRNEESKRSGITVDWWWKESSLRIGAKLTALDTEIEKMTAEMNSAFGEAGKAADELSGKIDSATVAVSWQQMGYTELGKAIQKQKDKLGEYSDASSNEAKNEVALLQAMTERYNALGRALGLAADNTKKIAEDMRRAPVDLIPTLTPKAALHLTAPEGNAALQSQSRGLQSLEEIDRRINDLQQQRLKASKDEIPVIDSQIAYVKRLRDEFEGISRTKLPSFSEAWGGIKGIGNSIRDIKNALTETDDAWDALTQTIDGFISMFQSLQTIINIIENITAVTKTMQAAKNAATQAELVNAGKEVAANTAKAGSGAAASVSSTPVVGPILAIAAIGSVIAALASLPKFAGGGLVYGPTIGLMGEYSGAANNPEVIAPLNKLRGILGSDGGKSEVKFRIEGRELVGILKKQNQIYSRS